VRMNPRSLPAAIVLGDAMRAVPIPARGEEQSSYEGWEPRRLLSALCCVQ
jgi:hypothetical protein